MNIGAKIKNRRLELGLTQIQLATKMGYTSKAAICKVENGQDNLTTNRIIQFAKALDLPVTYLMGWDPGEEDPDKAYTKAARDFYAKYLAANRKTRHIIDQLLTEEGDDNADC